MHFKVFASETKGVITTIQPINSLVSAVIGNTGKTTSLIPAEISPHEFKLKPSDAKKMQEGNIIFYISKHLESDVVKVFDIDTFTRNDINHYFITMSFVSGESLSKLVQRKVQLDVPVAVSIMIDVLKGLSSAHTNNPTIIHRDINPDNILLSYDRHNLLASLVISGSQKY